MGGLKRAFLLSCVLVAAVAVATPSFGWTVDLSLNQERFTFGDRLILSAHVDVPEDTNVGPVYLYIQRPYRDYCAETAAAVLGAGDTASVCAGARQPRPHASALGSMAADNGVSSP